MKTVLWEMKKSWLKLPLFIALIILAVINFYKYKSIYELNGYLSENTTDIKNGYYEYCENNLFGEITGDKIELIKKDYGTISSEIKSGSFSTDYDENRLTGFAYSDYTMFKFYIIPEFEYAVTYSNISNEIVSKAYENALFYRQRNNKKDELVSSYIYALYSDRYIKEFVSTGWVKDYFTYDFSSLLILIMIVMGLSSVFSSEYENGMNKIIASLGKIQKTTDAKLLSSAAYITLLTVFFTVGDLLVANHFIKIKGIFMPLYYSSFFKNSPFDFSFFTAVIVCAMIRLLVFWYIGGVTLIVSRLTKNSIITVSAMSGIITALIALSKKNASIINPVNALSPYKLLIRFDCAAVFGNPVLMLYIAVFLYAFLCIAITATIKIITRSEGRMINV